MKNLIPVTKQEAEILSGYSATPIVKILTKYEMLLDTAELVEDKMSDGSVDYYLRRKK